eukprot:scaffold89141_cov36-Cyclotella_meneghiniana.AAC.1
MKAYGVPVEIIRLDPAGENFKLERRCKTATWQALQPLKFEFTPHDTPQHNNLAELAFPYLAGLARAMMGAAWVPSDIRGKVCVEAIKCATQLDGLVQVTINGETKSRDEHVFGTLPNWHNNLHQWGEAVVAAEGKNKKTGDRGTVTMFVGYSGRESDSFRLWNPETNRVIVTRDVTFLGRMFYLQPENSEWQVVEDVGTPANVEPGDLEGATGDEDDEVEAQDEQVESEAGGNATTVAPVTTRSGRTVVPTSRYITEISNSIIENVHSSAAELRFLSLMAECDEQEMLEVMKVATEFGMVDIDLPGTDLNSCYLSENNPVSDNNQPESGTMAALFDELSLVGAGIGGGFDHTDELK